MLIVISPAKTLDFETESHIDDYTMPEFLDQSKKLVSALKKIKPNKLADLMSISPKLALLNFDRYHEWKIPYDNEKGKQALLAFKGEVFSGIKAESYSVDDFKYAQENLRLLSGLYGVLRPLDLILPYRLEMGTKLETTKSKNLYEFWGDKITLSINKKLKESNDNIIINLASNEYFKSINTKKLKVRIITPVFKDFHNGEYKMITVFAKKARGLMTSFILQNKITDPDQLKLFDMEKYYYNDELSSEDNTVFTRG